MKFVGGLSELGTLLDDAQMEALAGCLAWRRAAGPKRFERATLVCEIEKAMGPGG